MKNDKELKEMLNQIEDNQDSSIVEVHQGSWRIATEMQPILATKNLSNCIGILVYDLEKHFAFLSHSDNQSFIQESEVYSSKRKTKSLHLQELLKELKSRNETYHLSVIIFPGEYTSLESIIAVYDTLKAFSTEQIKIVSIEEREAFEDKLIPGTRTISFNIQTGELLPYPNQIKKYR